MICFIEKEATKHVVVEVTTFHDFSTPEYWFHIILACTSTVGTVGHLHKQKQNYVNKNLENFPTLTTTTIRLRGYGADFLGEANKGNLF